MSAWVANWSAKPDAADDTISGIERWVRSDALWRLVSEWGLERPPTDGAAALLDWLDAFSADHWDFRGGNERNLAASASLTQAQADMTMALSAELGLAPSKPGSRRYDAIVMTGGMVRAGIVKPRFVRRLIDGGVDTDRVVFLGAHRRFAGDEAVLARALAVPGDDEVDAMAHGISDAFTVGDVVRGSTGSGSARATRVTWGTPTTPRFEVVAAPSSEPEHRRANTADTFRHWAQSSEQVSSVLVVTTPIYVPYQAAVVAETMGIEHGMRVETVGVDDAASDLGDRSQRFEPQHHLQEIRSAIRGLRSLLGRAILHRAGM